MRTNYSSIVTVPPRLNEENVQAILDRISALHPALDGEGVRQYLCDLLHIKTTGEIVDREVVFQNTEPSVSSSDLHRLAERILPYNGYDMSRAVYATRNILNTVPESLDDLIDYTTKERLAKFISNAIDILTPLQLSVESCTTLEELVTEIGHFDGESTNFFIDLIGNSEMDASRLLSPQEMPGSTERQKMLYKAADYYLNHKIGFRCNTIWLACFISSQMYGCSCGWLHLDGQLCNDRHFGFKDDRSVPKLVIQSLGYINNVFKNYRDTNYCFGQEDTQNTVTLYMNTLLFSLDILLQQSLLSKKDNYVEYSTIFGVITENIDLLNQQQRLL